VKDNFSNLVISLISVGIFMILGYSVFKMKEAGTDSLICFSCKEVQPSE
jgi:hypothetical protein